MEIPEAESSQSDTTTENQGRCRREYIGLEGEAELIAEARRHGRKVEANDFRQEYYYGRCKDKKTCIWSGGGRQSWSNDPSSGITWVGVHGKDSICVVAKTGDLDLSRVHGLLIFCLADEVFRNFRRAVISEIEDLADPCSKLRKKLDKWKKLKKCIKTPFGVVSVVPSSDKIKKAKCYDYVETKFTHLLLEDLKKEHTSSDDDSDFDMNDPDARLKYSVKLMRRKRGTQPKAKDVIPGYEEEKTVKYMQDKMKMGEAVTFNEIDQESGDERYVKMATSFLEKKMESTEDFTLEETVKTAISAFQRLFNKKFKAKQIQVSVMDPKYFVLSSEDRFKDIYVNHLETNDIEKYLSAMSDDQEPWGLSDNRQERQWKRSRWFGIL